MKNYLVFDWDGTLHNTEVLYANAVRHAVKRLYESGLCEWREYSDHELSVYLGMSAADMWNSFMPQLAAEWKQKASVMVGEEMIRQIENSGAMLYEGTKETLCRLKEEGYELIILSNCKIAYLEAHRKEFVLDTYFTAYYPAERYDYLPKHEIMQRIMQEYPGIYTMIGDRRQDIDAGVKNHLRTVACDYGYGSVQELQDADIHIRDIRELVSVLKQ